MIHLESRCVISDEDCERNLFSALARNLPYCTQQPERTDRLAIVASGPSVPDYLEEIREFENIWAINGAYNYLVEQGIIPNGCFATDPLPALADYYEKADSRTTFYLSSFCDPAVYDRLKGHDIKVWFPKQDHVVFKQALPPQAEPITGGTTAVLRAPFLAKCLGFRKVWLYGADSSFAEGRYCYQDGTYPEDSQAPVMPVMINGEGPFFTELCLMKQVSQLGVMALHPTWGVDLKIRCKGLMDAFLRAPVEYDAFDD